jgi:ABC-type Zn uptake system ZnuABC Zn-binding protein ZnuA
MNNLEQALQALHCETADYMARELQKSREDEDYVIQPALISSIIKFLKDNDISCEIKEGTVHSELVKEVTREDAEFLKMVGDSV